MESPTRCNHATGVNPQVNHITIGDQLSSLAISPDVRPNEGPGVGYIPGRP